jgi:hypothetical protein
MTRNRKGPRTGTGPSSEMSLLGSEDIKKIGQPAPKSKPITGGRASRQKGNRLERAVVRLLQDHGLGAERVPLSGSAGGSYSGDISVPVIGHDLIVEVKARATGFRQLYAWLESRDALIVRADRREPLIILRARLAADIAAAAEKGRTR